MLQTRHKSKVSKYLSYPIGAEILSRELERYSGLPKLELTFLTSSDLHRAIEKGLPHKILRVSFVRWDKSVSIGNDRTYQDYLRGLWSLSVFPVARPLKSKAKEALMTFGLPLVADWMTKRRDPSWYYGRKECVVEFEPKNCTIEFRESVLKV
jgi:hypothetical protein